MAYIDPSTLTLSSPIKDFGTGTIPSAGLFNGMDALLGRMPKASPDIEPTPSFPIPDATASTPSISTSQAAPTPIASTDPIDIAQGDLSGMSVDQLTSLLGQLKALSDTEDNAPMTAQERHDETMKQLAETNPVKAMELQDAEKRWQLAYSGRGEGAQNKEVQTAMQKVLGLKDDAAKMDAGLKNAKAYLAGIGTISPASLATIPDTVLDASGKIDPLKEAQIEALSGIVKQENGIAQSRLEIASASDKRRNFQTYLPNVKDQDSLDVALHSLRVNSPAGMDYSQGVPTTYEGNEAQIRSLGSMTDKGATSPQKISSLQKSLKYAFVGGKIYNQKTLDDARSIAMQSSGLSDGELTTLAGWPATYDPDQAAIAEAGGTERDMESMKKLVASTRTALVKADVEEATKTDQITQKAQETKIKELSIDQKTGQLLTAALKQTNLVKDFTLAKQTISLLQAFNTHWNVANKRGDLMQSMPARFAIVDAMTRIETGSPLREFNSTAGMPISEIVKELVNVHSIPDSQWFRGLVPTVEETYDVAVTKVIPDAVQRMKNTAESFLIAENKKDLIPSANGIIDSSIPTFSPTLGTPLTITQPLTSHLTQGRNYQ